MDSLDTSKNADLIYQHTLYLLKEQKDSIIRLDTKLSALLGFSGLTLRFTESLHSQPFKNLFFQEPEIWCLLLKIISCLLAAICTAICVCELTARTRGSAVDPAELLKSKFYERDEETNKCAVTIAWIETRLGRLRPLLLIVAIACFLLLCFSPIIYKLN